MDPLWCVYIVSRVGCDNIILKVKLNKVCGMQRLFNDVKVWNQEIANLEVLFLKKCFVFVFVFLNLSYHIDPNYFRYLSLFFYIIM